MTGRPKSQPAPSFKPYSHVWTRLDGSYGIDEYATPLAAQTAHQGFVRGGHRPHASDVFMYDREGEQVARVISWRSGS